MPGAHQSHSISYLLSQEGEINLVSWVKIRIWKDHSPINCHGQNKLELGKLAQFITMGRAGAQLAHRGLHHGLQGNPCFDAWSTSPPPSSLTSLSAEFFFSHSHLSLPAAVAQNFSPLFLKYIIPEVQPLSLTGLALASSGSFSEPAGIGSAGHGVSFGQLLRAVTPVPLCYQNLAMQSQYRIFIKNYAI